MKTDYQTNERPVKKAGYSSARLHANRDRKRKEATARAVAHQEQWGKFSPDDRIACLYRQLPGQNAREIVRLQKQICATEFNLALFPKVKGGK